MVDDLKDLYPECDYISIHVPANDATKGMMNAEAFAQMKDGVIFLNFARDKLMNDDDLLAALASGKVAKYVTDFADDAVLNSDEPGIIVLPHLGASSAEAEDNCATMAVTQVMDYIENGNILNSVNMPTVKFPRRRTAPVCPSSAKPALNQTSSCTSWNCPTSFRQGGGEYPYILADLKTTRSIKPRNRSSDHQTLRFTSKPTKQKRPKRSPPF